MARVPLTPDERVEFDELLREIVGDDDKPKATTALADELYEALKSGEQAHRSWATRSLEIATRAGLKILLKGWIRSKAPVGYKTKGGAVIGLSRRAGVKRGDTYQQVMFEDMTPAEARAYLAGIESQLASLGALRTSVRRLIELVERHPDAETIGEALRSEGTTVDDVLGQAA